MARKKLLLFCEFLLMLKSCIFIQGVTIPNVQRLSAARLFLEGGVEFKDWAPGWTGHGD